MEKTTEFNEEEFAHLKHCLADLHDIHEKVLSNRLSWQDVRSLALPLRRLLLDGGGEIQRAWRLVGNVRIPFEVQAKEIPESCLRNELVVNCGNMRGAFGKNVEEFGASILAPKDFEEAEVRKIQWTIDFEAEYRSYTLPNYLASICMWVAGRKITRQNVLAYVANKAGGVHIDTRSRNPNEKEYEAFKALDERARQLWMNGKNLPYLEVQTMASQLVLSPNTDALITLLESELGNNVEWHFV